MGVVEAILERHDVTDIGEGDMFIGNDAYTGGGTHLPDIVLAAPIFYNGDLVGWATNLAHHADFVDRGRDPRNRRDAPGLSPSRLNRRCRRSAPPALCQEDACRRQCRRRCR